MRMVSHEFRTPVAAIRYASDMLALMLDRPQEAVAKRLHGIDDAVSRMTMLIDRFLASERHEKGVLKIEPVNFPALAEDVQRHFDHSGLGNRLLFRDIACVPDYWADLEMLRTGIVNLVDNALKYSPEDSMVEIAMTVHAEQIVIDVADRGIGIPERDRNQIGSRFYRASNTGGKGGSGLGLHACRQLVGYHMGRLELRARDGGGTHASPCRGQVSGTRPDVVILDISLPDGNGFDLAKALRAKFNCGIIMLTAHGDTESRVRGAIAAQTFTSSNTRAFGKFWQRSRACCAGCPATKKTAAEAPDGCSTMPPGS
ncbi:hypothetical protein GCM10007285_14800 [Stappia taiwanensis]|uniref:hybrid sensor histidine kinase/response regulator n=1 Tax=Stappia taiwanensis TaxID=992267 RepID=UPI0019B74951|nr:hybrid sensor histidine kinase/response regulator [Stappia taiwanensis]GGE88301.1 hypothetical protein GCM10007285_14800 [Stappia taiwanensis]